MAFFVKKSALLDVPIRAAELLFQPSLRGDPSAGVAETAVLESYSAERAQAMARHVVVTGGPFAKSQ